MSDRMRGAIDAEAIFSRRRDLVESEIDGETVMMSIESSKYYGIDAVGSRIWELLTERHSAHSITELLRREYDVAEADCLRDVLAFMNELLGENLIESVDVEAG